MNATGTLPIDLQPALLDVHREVRRLYGARLEELVLFGSQARGEARPDSDLDVLVILDDVGDWIAETRRLAALVGPLLASSGELVSFKVARTADYEQGRSSFLRTVRAEGIPFDRLTQTT